VVEQEEGGLSILLTGGEALVNDAAINAVSRTTCECHVQEGRSFTQRGRTAETMRTIDHVVVI